MANIVFSEGSGVNDSIYGKSQAPIRMMIEKRAEAFEAENVTELIFKKEKSTHWAEKYTSLTAMEGFKVTGENGAYPTDGQEEGFSKIIASVTWKNSFAISREIIEDSNTIDLSKKPDAFVTSYYRTRERFGAAMLGNAVQGNSTMKFNGGNFDLTCADGNPLFYAAHPAKVTGNTQCNLFSDSFSEEALGMLEVNMQNTTGDNDEILDIAPDTIIIPNIYALKKAVFAAVGSDKDPATANNGFNYQFGRWNIVVWAYLNRYLAGGTAPWLLMDSRYNELYGSLIMQDRMPLEVRSAIDENTDANVWRGRARYNGGFHDWRGIAVAGVAGATDLS